MNERGVATTDFLFALILVSGFSFIIFALAMTLMMVEVTQYLTFASARTYYAANLKEETQIGLAYAKFESLKAAPSPLAPLYRGGWFELKNLTISSRVQEIPGMDYGQEPRRNLFQGAFVDLESKVLAFQVPVYGTTKDESKLGDSKTFSLRIGSYLSREITHQECENMMLSRWKAIRKLDNAYAQAPEGDDVDYIAVDNGC